MPQKAEPDDEDCDGEQILDQWREESSDGNTRGRAKEGGEASAPRDEGDGRERSVGNERGDGVG